MRSQISPVGQGGRTYDQRVSDFPTRGTSKVGTCPPSTLPLFPKLHCLCDGAAVIAGGEKRSATISATSASSPTHLLLPFGMRWRENKVDRDECAA